MRPLRMGSQVGRRKENQYCLGELGVAAGTGAAAGSGPGW